MNKEKLFTIEDLEKAWNDGFNKTHSEWKAFKVKIVMEKVTQTLQRGLNMISENKNKDE